MPPLFGGFSLHIYCVENSTHKMPTAHRLEALVRGLALPEGRRVGRPGHGIAERWVEAQLRRLDLQFYAGDSLQPAASAGTAP